MSEPIGQTGCQAGVAQPAAATLDFEGKAVEHHQRVQTGDSAAPVEALGMLELRDDVQSMSSGASVKSLANSIFEYRKLHGRTYQGNRDYWGPNDDQQNEGLDLLHHAGSMLLDDRLFLAPLGPDPGRVLDVGTGTGIWAIDFADQFPESEVIGTDITPTQPTWVPPNLRFMMDDFLQEWTWPEDHFDFVHMRSLYGAVTDWEVLYGQALVHLKPGGWLENFEWNVRVQSDHVAMGPDHIFNVWADVFHQAGDAMGRSFRIADGHTMADMMRAAGFVDVVEKKIRHPTHGWPRDPRLRTVGHLTLAALEESVEGFALYVGTQVLGWTKEATSVLVANMRTELQKRSNCAYCMVTIVYGRKPHPGEV